MLFRAGKPISSLVIALAVTLAVNYAFSQLLLVPLPLGLLQPLHLLNRHARSRAGLLAGRSIPT